MAIINTGLLTKGLKSEFFNRLEATKTHYQDLSTRVTSTTDRETYRWLGTVPQVREWGTGRLAKGLRNESYSIENLKYESTLEVDRDEISDDQTGQIRLRVAELAERAATHKDFLIAQLLANGEMAGNDGYDGVSFINANHVSGASGTQSNLMSFDAADVAEPTVDEFKEALKAAISQMLGFKDDQGEPMMTTASGLTCVVPTTMLFTASEAINSTVIDNSTNVLHGIARVIAFPWLTDLSKWYLLKTDGVVRPFIFQDREPIEFNALTEDSDEGFRREKFLFGVRARYRMAYGYWQFAVRTDFI
ncbi:MAG: Mu-like prophage major head subunit gpT family protein [Phycisphaerales bacterium]|nr:Mu-like prophage major head subunit gpT family protein [Phycisphaerales bacterium]MCB9855936.1 Mu-like prophage major head subunit gpT family protein [Phycisphaerales bacterium]MCB9864083.1 Mu-like prophage major head subunit gpT family protein [Phycisphaerales bacterium]